MAQRRPMGAKPASSRVTPPAVIERPTAESALNGALVFQGAETSTVDSADEPPAPESTVDPTLPDVPSSLDTSDDAPTSDDELDDADKAHPCNDCNSVTLTPGEDLLYRTLLDVIDAVRVIGQQQQWVTNQVAQTMGQLEPMMNGPLGKMMSKFMGGNRQVNHG